MAKAKKALASLPWVDMSTVAINVKKQEVKFSVKDVKDFNEPRLVDAFAKVKFPNTRVVHGPK